MQEVEGVAVKLGLAFYDASILTTAKNLEELL
jgi:hypothetical protein